MSALTESVSVVCKGTPDQFNAASVYIGSGDTVIAEFKHIEPSRSYPYPTLEQMHANARLAIAAPELLEALEKIAPIIGDLLGRLRFSVPADASILPAIAAAIAKAKGEA